MKKILIFVIALISVLIRAEYLENLEIVKVVDGDTVHAYYQGQLHKIRLTEIDAPERNQPGGRESSAYLSTLLVDGVFDVEFFGKDKYGRDLGRIYDNEQDINRLMVRAGMAWVYDAYVKDKSFYKNQKLAQTQQLGVWSSSDPISPWTWRRNR